MYLLVLLLSIVAIMANVFSSNEEGLAYLAENAKKEGVVTLPSGLQYKKLKAGTGLYHPLPDSRCICNYHGTLINGIVFDSSYERGSTATFAPNQVIKGWTEAMQLMVEGDIFELTIPSELAYGERGSPPNIPPNSVLIFKIEILDILANEADLPLAMKCNVQTGEECNEKETAYLAKVKEWSAEKLQAEKERLGKLLAPDKTKAKPELVHWMERRSVLLAQLTAGTGSEEAEL